MRTLKTYFAICLMLVINSSAAQAGDLSIPHKFNAGTPALAAEVNANFTSVEQEVDDNDSRITALQTTVAELQTQLTNANNSILALQSALKTKASVFHNHDGFYAPLSHSHAQADITNLSSDLATHSSQISAINNSEVMALEPYFTVANDSRGPIATFSGINLQLVNGTGTTWGTPNGLGNLLIGYDSVRSDGKFFCSKGVYTDQTNCEGAGYTWAVSHKTGSHYLVIGDENNYSEYSGLVTGYRNSSLGIQASVTGGHKNTASGLNSIVSGGRNNDARGDHSSVSGGMYNIASGLYSSISGGGGDTVSKGNKASHYYSSILGGVGQTTSTNSQTIPALP